MKSNPKAAVVICSRASFVSERGWLNDNMTFKWSGGRQEEGFATYIMGHD
jgi:hypothetical protein